MEGKTDYSADKTVVASPFTKKIEALEFTDPHIPGEIKVDAAGKLLKTYFQYEGKIGSLIDEENNRITSKLPEQIASRTLKLENGEVSFENVTTFRPRIATGTNTWEPLYPQMARESDYTYGAEIYVDLVLNKGQQNEERLSNVYIGSQPVMLGSLLDHLSGMSEQQKIELGESIYDPFGYFIIKGSEKVILIQEQLRVNRFLIFNASAKGDVVCKVTNNTLMGSTNISMLRGKNSGGLKIHLGFMGKRKPNSKIGNTMSVFQIYRMLGISDPMEITRHIYQFTKPQYQKRMFVALQPSFVKLSKVADDIEYISKKKGVGDIAYDIRKSDIMNDLVNQLFPQIPAENIEDKLNMLSIMTVRLLEHLIGVRKLDDRDNWGNKQLVSAGKSLERLFSSIWRELINTAQDEIDTKNLHGLEAVRRILKPSFITENFVGSFTANNWGVKSSYLPKENITDFLKRDSILSVYSHLTKINTPTDRQTKNTNVRFMQMSQLGYVSPAETPEGNQCAKLGTPVLLADGTWKNIEDVDENTVITTVNSDNHSQEHSKIVKPFTYHTKDNTESLYKLTTVNGRVIEATGNHPFLTQRGWINLNKLKDGDLVCVRPSLGPMDNSCEEHLILSEEQFIQNMENTQCKKNLITKHAETLKDLGLLPLKSTYSKLHIISRMFGFVLSDGHINIYDGTPTVGGCFGTKKDAEDYVEDLERLGFSKIKIRYRETNIVDKNTGRESIHKSFVATKGDAFPSLLIALGISFGKKVTNHRKPIPEWIINGSKLVKREFISAFQGGDGNTLQAIKRKGKKKAYQFGFTEVIQHIAEEHVMSLLNFMKQISIILEDLGVKCTNVEYREDKKSEYMICAYRISCAEDNLIRYMDNIGYRYAFTKNSKGIRISEYLKYKALKIKERQELKQRIISLYNSGMRVCDIAKQENMVYRKAASIIEYYREKGENTSSLPNPRNLLTIDEFIAKNPIVEQEYIYLNIFKIEKVDDAMVADFTTVSENHSFIANGFVTHNCGLVKNSAITNYISLERPESVVLEHVSQFINKEKTEQTPNPFMLNGVFRGWVDGVGLRNFCVGMRRKLILFKDTLILLDREGYFLINTDSSRPTRPLLIVDVDGILVIEKKNLWNADMETLLREGCVEYIDAQEQEYIMLAQTMDEVSQRKREIETAVRSSSQLINKIASLEKQIEEFSGGRGLGSLRSTLADTKLMKSQTDVTLKELMSLPPYTHAELDPSAIESIAVSIIPLPETNPGPRMTYQAGMGKQSLGIYHSNHPSRFETTAKVLAHPSRPMVETQMNEVLGLNELPAGEMVILAITTYGGYSQEDAIIMSQGAIDRGLFRYTVYKKYSSIQKRTRNTVEEFTRPSTKPGEKEDRYHAISDNGLPILGSFVREGDCIIGKTRRYIDTGNVENASEYIEIKQEGIVDRVLVSTNQEGNRVVKVKIRQVRKPIMGDKFASRYAQKGTIGLILPDEDMPYTADGVRPDIIINPHCFTKDTAVTSFKGFSKRISEFSQEGGEKVWCWSPEDKYLTPSKSMGMESKGIKEIVKVFFEDGRIIRCTPDHRLLISNNGSYEWEEAQNCFGKKVVCGLEMPLDKPELDDDEIWELHTAEYIFNFDTPEEREKSLAFARLLGYILTDGCISKRNDLTHGFSATACLGHKIDVISMLDDIELITGKRPAHILSKGVWCIRLPSSLAGSMGKLPGVQNGRRAGQDITWPDFIMYEHCPLSVLREFIGGLFGGDGCAPHIIDRKKLDNGANFLVPGGFCTTCKEGQQKNLKQRMVDLSKLMEKLGVKTTRIDGPQKVRPGETGYKPMDGIQRYDIRTNLENNSDFATKIGFRYCIQKTCRLSAALTYWRFRERIIDQHSFVVKRTNEIYESGISKSRRKISIKTALDMAREEMKSHDFALNKHYSLSNVTDIHNRRSSNGWSAKKLSTFRYNKFPDVREWFQMIGCLDWFTRSTNKPEYIVKRGSMEVPTFDIKVIGIKYDGEEEVFDIGVYDHHSFLANGTVVHNCLPSRMTVGKMIEIVASKASVFEGERVNAAAFRRFDVQEFMRNLVEIGYSGSGKERMYSGFTGKPLQAMIFTGPCYYQALRHHVSDKIQMRARGGIKQLTHQPVGGRKRGGGQRVGEMERDAIISHGASAFLQERLCTVSDAYETVYCATCGTIAIADHMENKYVCRSCEDQAEFGTCTIPYSYKLLSQLLAGAHYSLKFGFKKSTEKN